MRSVVFGLVLSFAWLFGAIFGAMGQSDLLAQNKRGNLTAEYTVNSGFAYAAAAIIGSDSPAYGGAYAKRDPLMNLNLDGLEGSLNPRDCVIRGGNTGLVAANGVDSVWVPSIRFSDTRDFEAADETSVLHGREPEVKVYEDETGWYGPRELYNPRGLYGPRVWYGPLGVAIP